jgi:hypothetical protein
MKVVDSFTNASIFVSGKTVSVPRLANYAKTNLDIKELSVEWLTKNLGEDYGALSEPPAIGTPEYVRCVDSDLNYPILVIKEPSETWVGDGNHRLIKAVHVEKLESIKAYIITPEIIDESG